MSMRTPSLRAPAAQVTPPPPACEQDPGAESFDEQHVPKARHRQCPKSVFVVAKKGLCRGNLDMAAQRMARMWIIPSAMPRWVKSTFVQVARYCLARKPTSMKGAQWLYAMTNVVDESSKGVANRKFHRLTLEPISRTIVNSVDRAALWTCHIHTDIMLSVLHVRGPTSLLEASFKHTHTHTASTSRRCPRKCARATPSLEPSDPCSRTYPRPPMRGGAPPPSLSIDPLPTCIGAFGKRNRCKTFSSWFCLASDQNRAPPNNAANNTPCGTARGLQSHPLLARPIGHPTGGPCQRCAVHFGLEQIARARAPR